MPVGERSPDTSIGAPGGSRRRGDALLDAVCTAALEELAERGYAGMSIERIAERARTGKAVIYRHWPQRLDLVVDALDKALPSPENVAPDVGSLRGDLLLILRRIADGMDGVAGGAVRACIGHLDQDPDIARAIRERVLPRRKAVMEAILRRGIERGEVRAEAVIDRVIELGPMLLHAEVISHGTPVHDTAIQAIVDEILIPLLSPRYIPPPTHSRGETATVEQQPAPPQ